MGAGSSTVKTPPGSPQDAPEPGAAGDPAPEKQEAGCPLAEEATAVAAPEPLGDPAASAAPASPKLLQKNGQINSINGMPEGQVGDPHEQQEEAVILDVGQRDPENMIEKDDVDNTLVAKSASRLEEVRENLFGEIVEMPLSEEKLEVLEQPPESSDVGFKKVFKFVGVKLTVKKDKNDKSDPVELLTVKKDEVDDGRAKRSEDSQDFGSEKEISPEEYELPLIVVTKESPKESLLSAEVGNKSDETTSSLKKFFSLGWVGWRRKNSFKKGKEDVPEMSEKEKEQEVGKVDLVEIYEGKKEDTAEPVSEHLPLKQAIEMLSENEKVDRYPKDQVDKIQISSEEKAAPLATEVFDEKVETVAEIHANTVEEQEQTENPSTDVEQVDGSLFPALEKKGKKPDMTGMLAKSNELVCASRDVGETSPEKSALCHQLEGITSEVEILSSQERGKLQGSPLKKLFIGTGLKKLSGKKHKGKKGDEEIKSEELGELTQVSVESSETPEDQKGESSASSPEELAIEKGIVDTPQEVEIEEDGTASDGERKREGGVTPWASFKKMVTPKKRVRKLSESDKEEEIEKVKSATLSSTESAGSDNQEEIKGNGDDQKTEEPKRKVDTSVSWEALICVGSSKKRARKSSSSDEEGGPKIVSVDYYKSEDSGKNKESGTEITPIHSLEGDQGQINSSPELVGSQFEGEGVSTWLSFKRLVTPRKKSKSKLEERNEESVILSSTEHSASDIEPVKEESWVSIKKLIPGRRKKRLEGKQEQVPVEEDQTGVIEDDSDTPAVVPLSEYDAAEQEKNEARYAENNKAAKDLHEENSGQVEGLGTGEPIEGLVHAVTVTVVEGERAVTSIEERSPSWISTTITEPVEEATDQSKEPTEEVSEKEVLVERPATKTLPETKDIIVDAIVSEIGLTYETVTAAEETKDKPKQPTREISEKEWFGERPATKSLPETKDIGRGTTVSDLELASEAVTAVEEATDRPKQLTGEISEKKGFGERPATKTLPETKDTGRGTIVSEQELTSEAVTAAEEETGRPKQATGEISEKEGFGERPATKTLPETKDTSRGTIVSELELTSEAVTAAEEATDIAKQLTEEVFKKVLVERPATKTLLEKKDTGRGTIVSELELTFEAVTAAEEATDRPKQPTRETSKKEGFGERPAIKTLPETKDTSRGMIVSELELTSEAQTAVEEATDRKKQAPGEISEKEVLGESPVTKTLPETKDTSQAMIVSKVELTSEGVIATKEATEISKKPSKEISEQEVLVERPATKILSETKDTGRGTIVSELELTFEAVTAAKKAAEQSKKPTGKTSEKEILVEQPATEILPETKDLGRVTIVIEQELTSELVAATKEATEISKKLSREISEQEVLVERPATKTVSETKDTGRVTIVSEQELTSELVTATKEATEISKKPSREISEQKVLVERPATKILSETKDTGRGTIVSELELTSEAQTAAEKAKDRKKQPTGEISEKEGFGERPATKTLPETKDTSQAMIVIEEELTSEGVIAAEVATEQSKKATGKTSEKKVLVERPPIKTSPERKDASKGKILSALELTSEAVTGAKEATELSKKTTGKISEKEVLVERPATKPLPEKKEISQGTIVRELELTSEGVTAAKGATEQSKKPTEKTSEKKVLVERAAFKTSPETKDTSRGKILSELELTSEGVTGAKGATDRPKQQTVKISEKEDLVERPATKTLPEKKEISQGTMVSELEVTSEGPTGAKRSSEQSKRPNGKISEKKELFDRAAIKTSPETKDTSRGKILSEVELTSEGVTAVKGETEQSKKPTGKISEKEIVGKPATKTLPETKDNSRGTIVSELELTSEGMTAAKEATEVSKKTTGKISEKEVLVDRTATKTLREKKEISQGTIVSELELTSEPLTAVKGVTEQSKEPTGKISEKEIVGKLATKTLPETKDTGRGTIVSEPELTSEGVTATQRAIDLPKKPTGKISEKEIVGKLTTKTLPETKDMGRGTIVSEPELTSEGVTAAKEATDRPKKPTGKISEKEIVEKPAIKTLPETKDTGRGTIVSEPELTSEGVTAAKEATDRPKKPTGKISEKEVLVERPATKNLPEPKDNSSVMVVSDLELTSEPVIGTKEATGKSKKPAGKISEKEVVGERPATKTLPETKGTCRSFTIVSELELTSEPVTVTEAATERSKKTMGKISEKDVHVEKPATKIFPETKDTGRDKILNEQELTSEPVTATKEATEISNKPIPEISEKEVIGERPATKTLPEIKDTGRRTIVSELELTSEPATAAKEAKETSKKPTGKISEKDVHVERPTKISRETDTGRSKILNEQELTSEPLTAINEVTEQSKKSTGKISEKEVVGERPATKTLPETKDTGRGTIVSELELTSEPMTATKEATETSKKPTGKISEKDVHVERPTKILRETRDIGRSKILNEQELTSEPLTGIKGVTEQSKKPTGKISEKEVVGKRPATKTLPETIDTGRGTIVSELELTSEPVTVTDAAAERSKKTMGKISEKDVHVEKPATKTLPETKDTGRGKILSEQELTSEPVTATKEATEISKKTIPEISEKHVDVERPTNILRETKDTDRSKILNEQELTFEPMTAQKEVTKQSKKPTGKISEKEVNVERPATKTLPETKDTGRGTIVSEPELTSEPVTATKEATERSKKATGKISGKQVHLKRPGTKTLPETKDTGRVTIVSEGELTSEPVTAAKEATEISKKPSSEISEKDVHVERPAIKTLPETKDTGTGTIVSEGELTSEPVTAAKEATEISKKPSREISEQEVLVERPATKILSETKDTGRGTILNEEELTSEPVTAAKEAAERSKKPTGKTSEKEILVEQPATEILSETKDTGMVTIIIEQDLTSQPETATREATEISKKPSRDVSEQELLVERPATITFPERKDTGRGSIVSEQELTSEPVTAAKEATEISKKPTGKISEKEILVEGPVTGNLPETEDSGRVTIVIEQELTSEPVTATKEATEISKKPSREISEKEDLVERPATKILSETKDTGRGTILNEQELTSEPVTAAKEATERSKKPSREISEQEVLVQRPSTKMVSETKDTGSVTISEVELISEGVTAVIEVTEISKKPSREISEPEVLVERPATITFPERKDTGRGSIVSEQELTSEPVTAAKEATEISKKPTGKISEKEILVEGPVTGNLPETKDSGRVTIVIEQELTSEPVTATKEATEISKKPSREISEKEDLVERPATKILSETKDTGRGTILNEQELTSEPVTAAKEATERSKKPSREISEQEVLVQRPSTKMVSETKDTGSVTISEVELISEGVTAVIEVTEISKKPSREISEPEVLVERPATITFPERKDTGRGSIVSEQELTSEPVTAAKEATEISKKPTGKISEKEILVEGPVTGNLPETKDSGRVTIVIEQELTSEPVTATKEATEISKKPSREISEKEDLVERPATKILSETKDTGRGTILNEQELTSEPVTAAKEATERSKKPSREISEQEVLVQRPSTKMVSETKDTGSVTISEVELISEGVTAVIEVTEISKKPSREISEPEVLVERPATITFPERKDTGRGSIVSEQELTSEPVTAAKEATEISKKPTGKISEKEILVEGPVTGNLPETKDSGRVTIVIEQELTSEPVTATKEATEISKKPSREISEKEDLVERPATKILSETKDTGRGTILNEQELTSEPVTAAKEATERSKKPSREISEQEVLVQRPSTKMVSETKDTGSVTISEVELISEGVTAVIEVTEISKKPSREISEPEVLVERPATKTIPETKDSSRGKIVNELEPTSEVVIAEKEAPDTPKQPTEEIFEKEILVEREPAIKTLLETKDSSRGTIVSEVQLTSEAVTTVEGTEPLYAENITTSYASSYPSSYVSTTHVSSAYASSSYASSYPSSYVSTPRVSSAYASSSYASSSYASPFLTSYDSSSVTSVSSSVVSSSSEMVSALSWISDTYSAVSSASGMVSALSWISDTYSTVSGSSGMVSAYSHFSDSTLTTEFTTSLEELDSDTPDLETVTKNTQDVLQAAFEKVKQSRDVNLTTQSFKTNSNHHRETNLALGEVALMHNEVQEQVQTRKTEDITINDEQEEIIEQITSETFDKFEEVERVEVKEYKTHSDFLTCQAETTAIKTTQIPMKPKTPFEITTDEGTLVIHFENIREEEPVVLQEVSEGNDSALALGSEVVPTIKIEEDILTIETQSSRIVENVIQTAVELASAKKPKIKTSALQDAIETKTEPKVKESLDSNGPKLKEIVQGIECQRSLIIQVEKEISNQLVDDTKAQMQEEVHKYDEPCELPKSTPKES
ncbi:A-kinase anchor protein 12 isoform X2 [Gracilinanus agilis]|uniref:A-kinase anchor protein 12 isoform X2 n=1 Tax=Gracilinanus agilis TaxID=191870 RepID=UPI001CFE0A18|nr:A-kinase anchor protein 12 isoform X2 [Gracilinanus agilis]